MPACASENPSRFWASSPPISRRNSTASPPSPASPLSTSPLNASSLLTLKRSASTVSNVSSASISSLISNGSSSQTTVISSKPTRLHQQTCFNSRQEQCRRPSSTFSELRPHPTSRPFILTRIFCWYVGLITGGFNATYNLISYIIWAPALWVSAWLCLFWVILQLPLIMLKWFLTILYTPASERVRHKRCVLISGGSTVQAVHLARNFYKAGARVVVCEVDGLFGLARFSTACSKFYTLPKPGSDSAAQYVKALRDIVQKEKPGYYIPVSASTTAYYDALAKPHLEAMGCECFIPNASEVTSLDDPLELLRHCRAVGLPTPSHFVLKSASDVTNLYERGSLRTGRHVMLAGGPAGMRDRAKIVLPPTVRDFRNENTLNEISEKRPWVVIRDPGGTHYLTCTTVKNSRVVANVTCRIDEHRGLILEDKPEVSEWLDHFFSRSPGNKISGHLSFRLSVNSENELVSIGCRVGVALPYICHTGVHARLVWRPCRHFSRNNSEQFFNGDRHHHLHEAIAKALKRPADNDVASHLIGTVLDKRDALFVYWDPLPYCVYYHLQLPFRRIAGVIRAQPAGQHAQPLALVQ